jgi:hypothetical protein
VKQKKQLDVLVGQLRETAFLRTTHLYWAVAHLRGIDAEPFIASFPVDPELEPGLHWRHLRDTLSKDEADNLVDRLKRLQDNTETSE